MKPISKTAFFCCGSRMEDARSGRSLCGDTYAGLFMDGEGMRILESFKDERKPKASAVARHRIIDDLLRKELSASNDLLTVVIGAGFDSRAYRLGGGVWVELDEPQVFAFKDSRLPVSDCPNKLHRIPIDFATESVVEKLSRFSEYYPVVVVIEGVLPYLDEEKIRGLLGSLRLVFPRHKLICDVMTRRFLDKYGKTLRKQIARLGVHIGEMVEDPDKIIRLDGYRLVERVSIVETQLKFAGSWRLWFPLPVARAIWPTATSGYTVCEYDLRNQ